VQQAIVTHLLIRWRNEQAWFRYCRTGFINILWAASSYLQQRATSVLQHYATHTEMNIRIEVAPIAGLPANLPMDPYTPLQAPVELAAGPFKKRPTIYCGAFDSSGIVLELIRLRSAVRFCNYYYFLFFSFSGFFSLFCTAVKVHEKLLFTDHDRRRTRPPRQSPSENGHARALQPWCNSCNQPKRVYKIHVACVLSAVGRSECVFYQRQECLL